MDLRLNGTLNAISDISAYGAYPFTFLFPFNRPSSNLCSEGHSVYSHWKSSCKGSQT